MKYRFNPCFNGRCKRTVFESELTLITFGSFNPCFNGRCKRTLFITCFFKIQIFVSILVLMEDVKEQFAGNSLEKAFSKVSILVLMEDVKELSKEVSARPGPWEFQSLF